MGDEEKKNQVTQSKNVNPVNGDLCLFCFVPYGNFEYTRNRGGITTKFPDGIGLWPNTLSPEDFMPYYPKKLQDAMKDNKVDTYLEANRLKDRWVYAYKRDDTGKLAFEYEIRLDKDRIVKYLGALISWICAHLLPAVTMRMTRCAQHAKSSRAAAMCISKCACLSVLTTCLLSGTSSASGAPGRGRGQGNRNQTRSA